MARAPEPFAASRVTSVRRPVAARATAAENDRTRRSLRGRTAPETTRTTLPSLSSRAPVALACTRWHPAVTSIRP